MYNDRCALSNKYLSLPSFVPSFLYPPPFSLFLFLYIYPTPTPFPGRLNWWTSTGRLPCLEPLATSGDGNCLLHAASLYMWGFHDHFLILRTALHRLLNSGFEREGLKRRWRYQTQLRNNEAGGLTFSEEEWEFEWGEILRIATNRPRQRPTTDSLRRYSSLRVSYESLEEIHIFVLAHTLRRPVIVISDRTVKDQHGQDLAPIYFGGIYLPLEVNPTACYKSPVVLAYDSSHFSSLVAREDSFEVDKKQQQKARTKYARMSDRKETVIPLVTPDGSLLPVQFIYDPTKTDVQEKWSKMEYKVGEFPDDIVRLLENYLNIRWIQLKVSAASSLQGDDNRDSSFPIQVPKVRFPVAYITQESQPVYQKELVKKYLDHIKTQYKEEKEKKARWQAEREEEERRRLQNKTVPCEGEGCDMFGRPATNNLCSICYQKKLIEAQDMREDGEGGEEVVGGGASPHGYDEEEEEDIVNMHRRLVTATPSPPPPPYSQHVRRSPAHVAHPGEYGNSGPPASSHTAMDGEHRSPPVHATARSMGLAASPRRALHDDSNSRSPKHTQVQTDGDPHASGSTITSRPGTKQPVLPPTKVRSLSPNHKDLEGRRSTPNPTHPSPTHPLPPSAASSSRGALPPLLPRGTGGSAASSRSAPPPLVPKSKGTDCSRIERRAPPPPPTQQDEDMLSMNASENSHASSSTSSGATKTKNWLSNRSSFKKATTSTKSSGGSGGQYARDNIQPLHLDPTQQTSTNQSSGRGSGARKSCKTPDCDFFGSAETGWYCSSCLKKQQSGSADVSLV